MVTARRGLKRTNTVQLEAGLFPDAAAIGPVVQVWLVIVKSPVEAVGSLVLTPGDCWIGAATVTPVMFSGASPRFSTLIGTGAAVPVGAAGSAPNVGDEAYSAGAAAPRTASNELRAAANASNVADGGSSS